jgi:hypothetical protein
VSCDSTGAELHLIGELRTGAHLIEQLLGSLCHESQRYGFAEGAGLRQNTDRLCEHLVMKYIQDWTLAKFASR